MEIIDGIDARFKMVPNSTVKRCGVRTVTIKAKGCGRCSSILLGIADKICFEFLVFLGEPGVASVVSGASKALVQSVR